MLGGTACVDARRRRDAHLRVRERRAEAMDAHGRKRAEPSCVCDDLVYGATGVE
jgi:hypothetical protein